MKIVIDSNVWISALVFGGKPRKIFENVLKNNQEIAISDELVSEIRRILLRKFPNFSQDFEDLLVALDNYTTVYKIGDNPIDICRDHGDNFLLELSVKAQAEVLITGDNDLLSIGEFQKIKISKP